MDFILTKEEADEIKILLEDNNTYYLGFNLLRMKITPVLKKLSFMRISTGLYTTSCVEIYSRTEPKFNIMLYYYSDEYPESFSICINTEKIYYDWDIDFKSK